MENSLQNTITTIFIGILAAIAIILIRGWKTKDGKSKISDSTFYLLGFIFTPIGIITLISGSDGTAYFTLGIIYLTIGLALSKKSKKK